MIENILPYLDIVVCIIFTLLAGLTSYISAKTEGYLSRIFLVLTIVLLVIYQAILRIIKVLI